MDCSFGSDIHDFCVIKDQEMLDWVPPPGIWSSWGTTSPDRPVCRTVGSDLKGKRLSDEISIHGKGFSCGPTVCDGFFDESVQNSHGRSAYQFDIARVENTDEIFFSSLIDDQENEDLYNSLYLSPEFSIFPSDDQSIDMILGSESFSSTKHRVESSKQLETSVVSQSSSPYSEEKVRPQGKVQPEKVLVPSEQNISNGDNRPLEESIMQELETAMAKMTDKTRICFRDACYRLAKNSKEIATNQNGELITEIHPPSSTNHDEQLRNGKNQETELETNTIDRVIAGLMFNKMNANMVEFPIDESRNSKFKHKATGPIRNFSSHKRKMEYFHHSPTLTNDGEVSFLSEGLPKQTSNQGTHF